jgi:hypothetical protein
VLDPSLQRGNHLPHFGDRVERQLGQALLIGRHCKPSAVHHSVRHPVQTQQHVAQTLLANRCGDDVLQLIDRL